MTVSLMLPGRRLLHLLVWLAALLLLIGLAAPIITLNKFVLVENTFSVLSGILQLLQEGQFFLFAVIAGFSVLLPLLKLLVLFELTRRRHPDRRRYRRALHWMHAWGKWSMLDVFVVAVLVVSVKLGAIASVEMRYGLYAFAASVVLTMVVTGGVVRLDREPSG